MWHKTSKSSVSQTEISVNFHPPLNSTIILDEILPDLSDIECPYNVSINSFQSGEFLALRDQVSYTTYSNLLNMTEYINEMFGTLFNLPSKSELGEVIKDVNKARHDFFRTGYATILYFTLKSYFDLSVWLDSYAFFEYSIEKMGAMKTVRNFFVAPNVRYTRNRVEPKRILFLKLK